MSIAAAVATGLPGALPEAEAQQIRCWTNPSGTRECSDLPPPANAKAISDVRGRAGRIDGQESFAQRQAAQRFPVTLWTSDCGEPCTNARKLLTSRGVPFTERNPTQPALQEEFKQLSRGQMQVPVLIVGTSQLNGFEEGQWNTTLDAAGYGRTPSGPVRPSTAGPAQAAAPARPPAAGQPQPIPAGVPGQAAGTPAPGGPGGVMVPPQNAAGGSPGFAPLPDNPGGPGSPAGIQGPPGEGTTSPGPPIGPVGGPAPGNAIFR